MDRTAPGPEPLRARRRLDLSPLRRRGGLGARLRILAVHPMYVAATAICLLLVLLPAGVMVSLLRRDAPLDTGAVMVLVLLEGCGIAALVSLLRRVGTASRLQAFARANDMELTTSLAARHYTGQQFRSGRHIVLHSLTTRRAPIVEVGDSWPMDRPRVRVSGGGATVQNPKRETVFLRAVVRKVPPGALHGPGLAPRDPAEVLLTAQLNAALAEFAGEYTLELVEGEITVMGSLPLRPERPERIAEGFALIDALALRAGARPGMAPPAGAGPAGAAGHRGRRPGRNPLVVVGAMLALLVLLPFPFALVMSVLDDHLGGDETGARIVTGVLVAAMTVVITALFRWVTAGPGSTRAALAALRRPRPRTLLIALGAVAVAAAVLVVAVVLLGGRDPGWEDPDADLTSAAECGGDDPWCEWNVSQRLWAEEHGLTRVAGFDWESCQGISPERSTCAIVVECDGGQARLLADYEGTPREVVGARAPSSSADAPTATTTAEVEELVAAECTG